MAKYVSGSRKYTFTNDQPWSYGSPHGYIFHETAGASVGGAFTTLEGKGLGVHAIIDRDGTVYATGDLERRFYHAYEAARFYFGVEHVNMPQDGQDLTTPQLVASAEVTAEIVAFAKAHFGVTVPLVKKGCAYDIPGFMDHRDGKTRPKLPNGDPVPPSNTCDWNVNGHIDGLTSTWTWDQYLDAVGEIMNPPQPPPGGEDDLTPEEHALLVEARDNSLYVPRLADELRKLGHPIPPAKPGEPWASALAKAVAAAIGPPASPPPSP